MQVRTDNRELAGMEKLVSELEEKTFVLQEELQEIDSQFDEELDAKLAQYKVRICNSLQVLQSLHSTTCN